MAIAPVVSRRASSAPARPPRASSRVAPPGLRACGTRPGARRTRPWARSSISRSPARDRSSRAGPRARAARATGSAPACAGCPGGCTPGPAGTCSIHSAPTASAVGRSGRPSRPIPAAKSCSTRSWTGQERAPAFEHSLANAGMLAREGGDGHRLVGLLPRRPPCPVPARAQYSPPPDRHPDPKPAADELMAGDPVGHGVEGRVAHLARGHVDGRGPHCSPPARRRGFSALPAIQTATSSAVATLTKPSRVHWRGHACHRHGRESRIGPLADAPDKLVRHRPVEAQGMGEAVGPVGEPVRNAEDLAHFEQVVHLLLVPCEGGAGLAGVLRQDEGGLQALHAVRHFGLDQAVPHATVAVQGLAQLHGRDLVVPVAVAALAPLPSRSRSGRSGCRDRDGPGARTGEPIRRGRARETASANSRTSSRGNQTRRRAGSTRAPQAASAPAPVRRSRRAPPTFSRVR